MTFGEFTELEKKVGHPSGNTLIWRGFPHAGKYGIQTKICLNCDAVLHPRPSSSNSCGLHVELYTHRATHPCTR